VKSKEVLYLFAVCVAGLLLDGSGPLEEELLPGCGDLGELTWNTPQCNYALAASGHPWPPVPSSPVIGGQAFLESLIIAAIGLFIQVGE
jgi:hypothetical protein